MTKPDCFIDAVIGLFFTIILQKIFLDELKSIDWHFFRVSKIPEKILYITELFKLEKEI